MVESQRKKSKPTLLFYRFILKSLEEKYPSAITSSYITKHFNREISGHDITENATRYALSNLKIWGFVKEGPKENNNTLTWLIDIDLLNSRKLSESRIIFYLLAEKFSPLNNKDISNNEYDSFIRTAKSALKFFNRHSSNTLLRARFQSLQNLPNLENLHTSTFNADFFSKLFNRNEPNQDSEKVERLNFDSKDNYKQQKIMLFLEKIKEKPRYSIKTPASHSSAYRCRHKVAATFFKHGLSQLFGFFRKYEKQKSQSYFKDASYVHSEWSSYLPGFHLNKNQEDEFLSALTNILTSLINISTLGGGSFKKNDKYFITPKALSFFSSKTTTSDTFYKKLRNSIKSHPLFPNENVNAAYYLNKITPEKSYILDTFTNIFDDREYYLTQHYYSLMTEIYQLTLKAFLDSDVLINAGHGWDDINIEEAIQSTWGGNLLSMYLSMKDFWKDCRLKDISKENYIFRLKQPREAQENNVRVRDSINTLLDIENFIKDFPELSFSELQKIQNLIGVPADKLERYLLVLGDLKIIMLEENEQGETSLKKANLTNEISEVDFILACALEKFSPFKDLFFYQREFDRLLSLRNSFIQKYFSNASALHPYYLGKETDSAKAFDLEFTLSLKTPSYIHSPSLINNAVNAQTSAKFLAQDFISEQDFKTLIKNKSLEKQLRSTQLESVRFYTPRGRSPDENYNTTINNRCGFDIDKGYREIVNGGYLLAVPYSEEDYFKYAFLLQNRFMGNDDTF